MIVAALAARSTASAQGTSPTAGVPPPKPANNGALNSLVVTRTDAPPTIDGRLDDVCWADAPAFESFTQVVPVEGAVPTEGTVVRVLFDTDNLYIAVRCFDGNPAGIIAKQMQRDGDMKGDDTIEVVVDPFGDQRNGYLFRLSAAGGKADGLVEGSKREVRLDWDGIWYGKAAIDDPQGGPAPGGWSAEFSIPFKTISFNPAAAAWGFNVQRTIRRKQEVVRWASPRANTEISSLGDAGTIEGIAGINQGLGLTLKPYASTRVDLNSGGLEIKPGFDLFYKLTPSTTAAVTVNTDFAEAEVDERRVNLTRFPLFFPEKRDFFLQDATVFSFGGINQSPLPFQSRRIGIVNGEQKDILAGVRVTGREGGLNFGVMDVQMHDDSALGSKNLSVGRLSANVLEESTVGLIFTHGDPSTTGDNTLVGGDFNYRTSGLFGDQVLEAHAWTMATFSDEGPSAAGVDRGMEGTGTAFGAKVSYPNDRWAWSVFAARYAKSFNPALGFIERPGTYEANADLRYRWRPDGFIRRVDLKADQNFFLDLDGNVQTQEGGLPGLELEDKHGDQFFVEYQLNRDVLTEPFEITDGVTIPTGDHRFNRIRASVEMAPSRALSPTFRYRAGDYYTGTRTDYIAMLNWRPSSQFFGSLEYEYDGIDLPEGSFVVRIIRARANVIFSPALSWNNTVQYDNESRNMGINSRVRWELEPGREVFFVVNQGYDVEDGHRFHSTTSSLTVKVGLTFRF